MAVRINGVTFRSGCDINILMTSVDRQAKLDTPEAREARIEKYAERFANGLPIFDEDDTVISEDDELSLIADDELPEDCPHGDYAENFDEQMPYSG